MAPTTIGEVLVYATIPVLAVYFYLFQRTMRSLPLEERRRFVASAGLPVWRRLAGLAPVPLLLIASTTFTRMFLTTWLLVQLVADTRAHHRRLATLGFAADFRHRLLRVSAVAAAALVLFMVGMVLRGAA